MDDHMPILSVVLAVYNGERYLGSALKSILDQTFKDFECIVIDDGSTDCTPEILKEFTDSRLKIISQENKGLTKSLNYGISISRGIFIARMDADDIADLNRFKIQLDFLQQSPEVAVCGTLARLIDTQGADIGEYCVPINYRTIRRHLLFHNPFIHPSVIFRKNIFYEVGGYDETYRYAQDYELWSRIVPAYKTINIDQYLLKYRKLDSGITKSKNLKVRLLGIRIRILYVFRLISGLL